MFEYIVVYVYFNIFVVNLISMVENFVKFDCLEGSMLIDLMFVGNKYGNKNNFVL